MARVFISLGSNLGDRLQFLQRAIDAIAQLPSTTLKKVSSVYETEPVGVKNQPGFLNAVAELQTSLTLKELFQSLKDIERTIGRTKTERWGPREIDLDLLYYNTVCLKNAELQIPHPEIQNRKFVLIPLIELAEDFIDPVTKKMIKQILEYCPDTSTVMRTSLNLVHFPQES